MWWWTSFAILALTPGDVEVYAKLLVLIVAGLTLIGLGIVTVTAYRVWNAADRFRRQLIDVVRSQFADDTFRKAVRDAALDWTREIARAEMATALMQHDQNQAAHRVVLEKYPDRRELQGALDRMEAMVQGTTETICAKLDAINKRFDDWRRDERRDDE